MKHIFTQVLLGVLLSVSVSARAQDSLFISELSDPADEYAGRFIELFNAGSEAVDFSTWTCFLSRQSNGGTTWGDLQLAGIVSPGATFVIGGSGFEALYGFAPDQETGILIGNGDDAYALFAGSDHETGVLHDVFGVLDVDGSGEAWEYEDSRALRLEGILVPNTSWTEAEWVIAAADVADCDPGTHLGSGPVLPPGDFALAIRNDTVNWGEAVEVAVQVSPLTLEDQVISYQFDLDYDTLTLSYAGASLAGTMAEGGTVAVNDQVNGHLSVGYMTTTALTGSGQLLELQFNALTLDTTILMLSSAFLNSTPVTDLTPGTVIITETAPPTAVITYGDTLNRFADTLLITASFSEAMDPVHPVLLNLEGAVALADVEMTRINEVIYSYLFPIPKTGGEVSILLSNGCDLWGNEVVSQPLEGGTFTIVAFIPGDVDDDGVILAYDAALTLQYSVGMDPIPALDPLPWENWRDSTANVDGTAGISAHDAGLILQYSAGIITTFQESSMKSSSGANVTMELEEQDLVFYSHGEVLGFNLNAECKQGMLGIPKVLEEGYMSAVNMSGDNYRIGLCTAFPVPDGTPILKIPIHGSGAITFQMMVNTVESVLHMDMVTGLSERGDANIDLYPNPVAGLLHISGLSGRVKGEIFSIHGQLCSTFLMEECSRHIDVSGLSPGIYMLRLEAKGRSVVKKFSKQ